MLAPTGIVTPRLLGALRRAFAIDWTGIHGVRHWGRVRANGLRLAAATGADARVVELFAVLHDSRRVNDGRDPGHGARGAENARRMNGHHYHLDDPELELLCAACTAHSRGLTEAEVTVQVCWDADRLDLGRVGIEPSPARLCTAAARDPQIIAWAYRRSLND
jgi:uncharacterized protein